MGLVPVGAGDATLIPMHVVIGGYRGVHLIERSLASFTRHVTGITRITVVDDSGAVEVQSAIARELDAFEVATAIPTSLHAAGRGNVGYTRAMQVVCSVMGGERAMLWEEDFVATDDIDLDALDRILDEHIDIAQIALLRGPWFPNERRAGGLLPALVDRLGEDFVDLREEPYGWSQRGTWTCNPAVWREGIALGGWPSGKWTEDKMRDRLLADGWRFGFIGGVKVKHDGVRSGTGY